MSATARSSSNPMFAEEFNDSAFENVELPGAGHFAVKGFLGISPHQSSGKGFFKVFPIDVSDLGKGSPPKPPHQPFRKCLLKRQDGEPPPREVWRSRQPLLVTGHQASQGSANAGFFCGKASGQTRCDVTGFSAKTTTGKLLAVLQIHSKPKGAFDLKLVGQKSPRRYGCCPVC